jgi:hypothetical protein
MEPCLSPGGESVEGFKKRVVEEFENCLKELFLSKRKRLHL